MVRHTASCAGGLFGITRVQPQPRPWANLKRLTRMRHAHPVLARGSLSAPLFVDGQLIVQLRQLGSTWAVVALNNGSAPRRVQLPLPAGVTAGELQDALGGQAVQATAAGLVFEVPALFGRVLVSR